MPGFAAFRPSSAGRFENPSRVNRRILMVAGGGLLVLGALSGLLSGGSHAVDEERTVRGACSQWDEAATKVLADIVQAPRDSELRQVGDAIFRIRRARRNCEAGWPSLACLDYAAVMRRAPRAATPVAAAACPSPASGPLAANARRP